VRRQLAQSIAGVKMLRAMTAPFNQKLDAVKRLAK